MFRKSDICLTFYLLVILFLLRAHPRFFPSVYTISIDNLMRLPFIEKDQDITTCICDNSNVRVLNVFLNGFLWIRGDFQIPFSGLKLESEEGLFTILDLHNFEVVSVTDPVFQGSNLSNRYKDDR